MKLRNIIAFHLLLVVGLQSVKAQEAYACYTSGNETLTFYYDNLRSSRSGSTYNLNAESFLPPGWYNALLNSETGDIENVTKVVFDPSFADARPRSTHGWFRDMTNLQTIIGFEYLNTSEVIDMAWMFNACEALTSIDVSNFNTSKVKDMRCMFCDCHKLTSLDLSNFNTAKVTEMGSMFATCVVLQNLYISNFNTANVTSLFGMFQNCHNLSRLYLSSFNTANVTDMNYMFKDCNYLETIYVGDGWSTAAVTESEGMFKDDTRLVGSKGTTFDSNHINASYAHIDGGTSNPGYFSEAPQAYACYTSGNETLTFYYDNLRSSRSGSTYDLNTGNNAPDWYYALVNPETYDVENITY